MNVIARFDGVPPNMSVRRRTPASPRTRSMARAMSSLASVTSSCQPIDTAANRGRSPTIISAALSSSVASCPWVTTTTPITRLSYGRSCASDVTMTDAERDARNVDERALQALGDHDRPVASPGAADGDGQIRLSLEDVMRHDIADVVFEPVHEFSRRLVAFHEGHDGAIASGPAAQRGHEVRIRQAADVEREVGVTRQPVFVAEAQQRQDQ